jgi:lysozyme
MEASEKCLELIRMSEGLRLLSYKDSTGKLTIGYGSTLGVVPNQQITEEMAELRLHRDASVAAKAVERLVIKPLKQRQFDGLVDFVFNLGEGRLKNSTMLKYINQNPDDFRIGGEMQKWVYGKNRKTGKMEPLPGLVIRRHRDAQLYYTGDFDR